MTMRTIYVGLNRRAVTLEQTACIGRDYRAHYTYTDESGRKVALRAMRDAHGWFPPANYEQHVNRELPIIKAGSIVGVEMLAAGYVGADFEIVLL